MTESDESTARPRFDTSINLLTMAVVGGGIIVGFTANREAVKQNASDVAAMSQALSEATTEIEQLGNRVLTIENGLAYRAETVEAINRKIDRLIEIGTDPPGDRNGR